VGYDDSTHLTDEESFQDVLKFIDQHDMKKVRAIVWTVMSQERNDARLQRQADFINQFKPGEIWRNVIILVKHPGSFNPQLACQGALVAAKAHAEWMRRKLRPWATPIWTMPCLQNFASP
jgi:hypothetical protein